MGSFSAVLRLCTLLLFLVPALYGCRESVGEDSLTDLLEMESREGYAGRGVSEDRIEELTEAIERYREIVEEKVDAADQMGVYYKLLGQEYLDRRMYGLALEAFETATEIHPENATLYFKAGVCAGRLASTRVDPVEERRLLELAEAYYRQGLSIDPTDGDLLYGLAILYVFELDLPEEAVPLMEQLVNRQPKNLSALFLLGRAYAEVGRTTEAVEAYERAAAAATSEAMRSRALRNARELLGES